jgi:hypothetical protein
MAERRRQGLCFNCDEKFVRGHKCAHLFLVEYDDSGLDDGSAGDGEPTDDEPRISLYAVVGVQAAETVLGLPPKAHGFPGRLTTGASFFYTQCLP